MPPRMHLGLQDRGKVVRSSGRVLERRRTLSCRLRRCGRSPRRWRRRATPIERSSVNEGQGGVRVPCVAALQHFDFAHRGPNVLKQSADPVGVGKLLASNIVELALEPAVPADHLLKSVHDNISDRLVPSVCGASFRPMTAAAAGDPEGGLRDLKGPASGLKCAVRCGAARGHSQCAACRSRDGRCLRGGACAVRPLPLSSPRAGVGSAVGFRRTTTRQPAQARPIAGYL